MPKRPIARVCNLVGCGNVITDRRRRYCCQAHQWAANNGGQKRVAPASEDNDR